ncbi:3-hydroxyacyl-CoA dehydrogenase NAD-binding domain-containing protein [Gordonia jacobaea]|uniref:3-hydroxyacyl-CoA dehydrogenase NAD-binding domain-containing protein n=1 Tax=Gordonia jacobaea TaxID=122202 RepID=UPI003D758251
MSAEIRAAGVVGAGAIGLSWIKLLARQQIPIVVADPDPATPERVRSVVGEWSTVTYVDDAADAARRVDIVFEAGPERIDVKRTLFAAMDASAPPETVLTSSSSGFTPSEIQGDCTRPERVVVAHPFNPPDLVPLVEVVGGKATDEWAVEKTMRVLASLGKRPIRLRQELPGHVANRLQAALWREAYHLIGQGVVSVSDLDEAIAYGPGLRWALLGPIATQHLSGGAGGLRHVLDHLGPPMVEWWDDLGSPILDRALVDRLVSGVEAELDGQEVQVRERRDEALRQLLVLKTRSGLADEA